MILRAALALLLVASPAVAQDRQGRDTPGEWVVTHHQPFGLWDSFCDERRTGDILEERCYVRYVEVYSPRPNFGAMFFFLTPDGVEFGMERGISFAEGGFRVERDGAQVWSETRRACLRGRECTLEGDAAQAFEDVIAQGGALRFTFEDRQGNPQDLSWDLGAMADILADYRAEAAARGLL